MALLALRARRALWLLYRVLMLLPPLNLLWIMGLPLHAARRRKAWRRIRESADRLGLQIDEKGDGTHCGVVRREFDGRQVVLDTREGIVLRALFTTVSQLDVRERAVDPGGSSEFPTGVRVFDALFRHRRASEEEVRRLAGQEALFEEVFSFVSRNVRLVKRMALDYYGVRLEVRSHLVYPWISVEQVEALAPELVRIAGGFEAALGTEGKRVESSWFLK